MNQSIFDHFTNKYQLSKTLRFELKPQGKTLERITEKGLITQDQQRAIDYKTAKGIIDEYHKAFIEKALSGFCFVNGEGNNLNKFKELYSRSSEQKKTDEKFDESFKRAKENLRKEIVKKITETEGYKNLFTKELIVEDLPKSLVEQSDKDLVGKFKTFTTYFTGFHDNRKNMYTDKEQSTAIAYRLVHENLPKFLDNERIFEKVQAAIGEQKLSEVQTAMQMLLNHRAESLSQVFTLDYFNKVLTQNGIDFYNTVLGGWMEEKTKIKVQGLNEYINLYNQQQTDKSNKLPRLKPLYKMILSDRESVSFLPDAFENAKEVVEAVNEYYKANLGGGLQNEDNVLLNIKSLLAELHNTDHSMIYIRNDKTLSDISQAIYGDWSMIKAALEFSYLQTLTIGKKGITKKQEEAKEKYLKQSHYSITEIETVLHNYKNQSDTLSNLQDIAHPICDYFKNFNIQENKDLIVRVSDAYSAVQGILNVTQQEELSFTQQQTDSLKFFLDRLLDVLHFVKPIALPKDSSLEKNDNFYSQFLPLYEELDKLILLYNKVRNFATKKPYSTEKIKLNFENSTLGNGWDLNKEPDNTMVLLRKKNLYYLGIMDKKHNKVFKLDVPKPKEGEATFEKIIYKLLPGANKMLPKVFLSQKGIDTFKPSEELLKKYQEETHKKGDKFKKDDMQQLIDYFKISIAAHEDWKHFGHKFSDTTSYEDLSGFYREVEKQGYKIAFQNIPESYIDQLVENGKLYLFQIYNKDFSAFSKGKPNIHTYYWKALFEESNLANVVYKLNGEAEVFYRKRSITDDKIITHKKNFAINNKNPLNKKATSMFKYDLIKDKRYTLDKFQFHVPITINFKAEGNEHINEDVNSFLKNNPNVNIIGLDRGERHLIYLTLINQMGKILKQFSLNEIVNEHDGNTYKTNYHSLLDAREGSRDEARRNWGAIETIKQLKEGYVSQVVHKIARLMVEYNAIVVMEDLNFGFKRGRFKVEKQVYQKLEKMLIDKLNYLVFKDKLPTELGGIYNALQLANKFTSFKDMGKQSGFLFYVPAWNTSKIDPTTGFVNLFDTRYDSIDKAKTFFSKFNSIRFNQTNGYFEFAFDYNDFTTKAEGTKTNWTVCTHGERILTYRNPDKLNQWDNKSIKLTEEFEELFGKQKIAYGDGVNIVEQIANQNEKDFFVALMHLFKLTLQMRNSISNSEVDYLISPVADNNGNFFDTRKATDVQPENADANGAYNVARKGLWVLQQIRVTDDLKKLNLSMSNKEWLQFVQK